MREITRKAPKHLHHDQGDGGAYNKQSRKRVARVHRQAVYRYVRTGEISWITLFTPYFFLPSDGIVEGTEAGLGRQHIRDIGNHDRNRQGDTQEHHLQ